MKKISFLKRFVFFLILSLAPFSAESAAADTVEATLEIRLLDVIKTAIEKNYNVKIYESQKKATDAGQLSAASQFDPQFKASVARSADYTPLSVQQKKYYAASSSPDVTKIRQGSLTYTVSYEKRYRNGIMISPSVTVASTETNNPQSSRPYTNSKIQFAVIKPLARGKSLDANTAEEKTSKIESEGASLDLLYAVSSVIREAVSAYWNYAYYYKALQLAEASRARNEKLYADTKLLVENSEVAAAELDQLTATLNDKEAECERAAHALLESRNKLKIAMGLPAGSLETIGPPADFFPVDRITGDSFEVSFMINKLVDIAGKKRYDYLASLKRLESYNFSIPAARDALKPQIDLQFSTGYSGMKEDKGAAALISAMGNDVPGANVSATVSYSIPIDNKSARAGLTKQEEQFAQAKMKADETMRQLILNIQTYADSVASVKKRYKKTVDSGKLYQKALDNEKEKNRMGASTLLNIVNMEDRLDQAELSREAAVLEYAGAVLNLRFEAGCIGRLGTSECEVKMEDFISLPEVKNIEK